MAPSSRLDSRNKGSVCVCDELGTGCWSREMQARAPGREEAGCGLDRREEAFLGSASVHQKGLLF